MVATELEFYVFSDSYEALSDKNYSELRPLYHRHGDHDVLVTGFLDRFLAPVRQAMAAMGVPALSTIGEGGVGQAEINFGHGDPLSTADHHVLFKHTTKALAEQQKLAATFMAKPKETAAGSGCHIHLSLWDAADSSPVTPSAEDSMHLSERARAFLAGVLKYSAELAVLHAPYANSYRRLQPGSWAPITATWGYDNRTVLARVLGSGSALRVEFRLPGADANPYLSIAALLAAGIAGLDERAALSAPSSGDASMVPLPAPGAALPRDLGQATLAFDASALACEAFGAPVHAHLAARAEAEWASATRAVTDWDRRHGFEGA
jgi:glutamine synthetase